VLFPDILTKYFSQFFTSTINAQDFRKELFHDVFTIGVPCKCTIRRSATQAKVWKREWQKAFAIKL
jgi:hypothetical protein